MTEQDKPKMDEASFDYEAQRLSLMHLKRKLEAELKRRSITDEPSKKSSK